MLMTINILELQSPHQVNHHPSVGYAGFQELSSTFLYLDSSGHRAPAITSITSDRGGPGTTCPTEEHSELSTSVSDFEIEVIPGTFERIRVLQHNEPSELEVFTSFSKTNRILSLRTGQSLSGQIGPGCIHKMDPHEDLCYVVDLSAKDVRRWMLAAKVLQRLDALPTRNGGCAAVPFHFFDTELWHIESSIRKGSFNFGDAVLLGRHISNLPPFLLFALHLDSRIESKLILPAFILLETIYGSIHLFAWSFEFASSAESLLWKIACIGITADGALLAVWARWLRPWVGLTRNRSVYTWVILAILWTMFLFYGVCRIYIVVESFVSLRWVPVGVYATVPWVQSIPHL
jgi:hypothetical protein